MAESVDGPSSPHGDAWEPELAALRQSVSYHVVYKRDKLDETSKGEFTDIVSANVSGVLSADWINRHSHSREIIFKEVSRSCLSKTKILKDIPHVHDLFAALASDHAFSLRSWKGNGILPTRLPADWTAIERKDKTGMGSAGIGITSPICIDPTPEEIGVFNTTTEENTLFIRAAKISKHMFSGCHM
jgi:hypothetical protein